jgi:hypothetical protein
MRARRVPIPETVTKIIDKGVEYPGFKYIFGGTPVGICPKEMRRSKR